jgi:putative ABC transport system permease protein
VSGGYMNLLGGRTSLGRPLGPSDDRPGAPAVIVVSHYFWRTNFDGDPAAVGRTVWVNSAPVTLVGVLQPGFTGPNDDSSNAIWATLAAFDDVHMGPPAAPTSGPEVQIVGRLSPGAGSRALRDNLAAILARPGASTTPHGASHVRGATSQRVQVHSAASPMSGPADLDTYAVLGLVFGITGLVLTLACANVANLLMASACTRVREVGVRLAMGATRRRVLTQLVTESVLMALVAGALGFLCAFWLVPVFARVADVGPELDLLPDLPVLFFTLGVALLCGLGAGLSPARFGARGHVAAALQAQGGTRRAGLPSRLRTSFVAFQAAVAMTLLVVAVLFTRSAIRMTSVEIGFDQDRLLTVFFDIPRSEFDEPAYVDAALAAVRRLPSVERVSVSQYAPFGFSVSRDRFTHEGRSFDVTVMPVDAEFFETSGVRVLRGRAFTADEVADEAPVALISQSLARTFFRGHDPVGRSLSALPSETGMPQDPATIVGVAADALLGRLGGQQYGAIYRPLAQQRDNPPTLVIRSARPGATARAVEEAIRGIDPRVRATTRFVRQEIDEYLSFRRRLVWVFGPAAAMALVLAALGVYGVTAFVVGQRTEEVSVRMALGASATDVLRLLVSDSLRPIVIGLAVGLGLALAFSLFWAAEEMPGISPLDPLSIGLALTVLLAAALIAVLVPAGRAARADPAQLLRQA